MYRAAKRALDILGSGVFLIVSLPLMAAVAIAVRLRMGSPILFRHPRPGFMERTFGCLKFRTMTDARDANGKLLPDEVRLTPFGIFLRRYSLDELPQFWNVFKGEMSLVGPRPLEMRYLPRYSAEQRRRHHVKPGITGWAQINGRNALSWEQKFAHDVWYVDHCSFWLDLKILCVTAWKVISAEGVSHSGHATMPDFEGTSEQANSASEN
jgi:sugar transferase EpsL